MPITWPRSPRSSGVAPRDRAPLPGAGDDVALVVGELLLAAQRALEVGPPPGAILLGDDDVVPVAADQVALAVADQLAAVAVEQVDRLVGAQDEQDRAGDVEVVLGARLGELARGDVDQQALAGLAAGRRRRARRCRAPRPRPTGRRPGSGGTRGRSCRSRPGARARRRSSSSTRSRSSGCRRSNHSCGSATKRSAGKPSRSSICGDSVARTGSPPPSGRCTTPPVPVRSARDSGDLRACSSSPVRTGRESNRCIGQESR